MPLDDREQRILADIERRFYEEDPAFAQAVKNIDRPPRFGLKVPLLGLIVGIVLVLVSFTTSTVLATVGFVVMVASASSLVRAVRLRGGFRRGSRPRADRRSPRFPRR